ncbi:TspO protein [Natronococcus pandeyae]|uniref:TspO protein n=1 Tax=Natronococcus pandeyae TaxID=2055836 RepID=A0A8J8Q4P5_9EURY|nr:TspO/MBR family protein [Natronococcus pandeyae]TYL38368.1 TspO protein [Natronococcus pandeyae]
MFTLDRNAEVELRGQDGDSEWRELASAIAFCELTGVVPGLITADARENWYPTLEKPPRTPPDWAFPPVWTVLFAAMGVAWHLIRRARTGDTARKRRAEGLFLLQLALNALWTLVFFGRRSTFGGLVVIALLGPAIALTLAAFARVDRRAALLLVPYLLWVAFATTINYRIWKRNR